MNNRFTVIALGIIASTSSALAIDVHLDWTGAESQLQLAWDTAFANNSDDLTTSEINDIQSSIKSGLESAYAGFTINFTTTTPASTHEKLIFGNTTASSGLFGQASQIDWRNKAKTDTADIYLKNFNRSNNILSTNFNRLSNIDFLKKAILGTTAHELGHNLGLQHYDPFGYSTNTYNGGYDAGSTLQNNNIMATGATGLTSEQRRTATRNFSELSKIKLEFADGVAPVLGKTVAETAGNNDSIQNAQALTGEKLSLSGKYAVVVDGSIGNNDEDYFSFYAMAGTTITANTFGFSGIEADPVNTIITIRDANGFIVATNDNITFYNSELMGGTSTFNFLSYDSLILNYEVAASGQYFIKVDSRGPDSIGDYELLLVGAVPEPATMTLLALGALTALRKKRQANKSA